MVKLGDLHFSCLSIEHSDVSTCDVLLSKPCRTNEMSKTFDNQHLHATGSRWHNFLEFPYITLQLKCHLRILLNETSLCLSRMAFPE
jgi:hypothetical protein